MNALLGPLALGALVLLPAAVGVTLLLGGRRADRVAGPAAVTTALLTVGLAPAVAATRPTVDSPFLGVVPGGGLALAVDGLSAVLLVGVAVVAAAVLAFAETDTRQARGRLLGHLLLFTAAMLATVSATTLPTLLLAWEIMGATSYALIGLHWDRPGKTAAGSTAFVTTRAGDLGLYVAAGAAVAGTGSLELAGLASAPDGWRDVAAAGILVAALGKSAQLPFSAWLSAAMEGPSAVSALLHSATMVAAGAYLLLRTEPLLAATGWAGPAAAWTGALTAVVLGLVAAAQTDLKQLLAASTGAQIGFVVLAAGVGSTAGGTAQLLAHAGVKAGLFVVAGSWLTALGTKQLPELRGVARRSLGGVVTVAALALAGVPPLALWVTKDWSMVGAGGPLRAVALVGAALSAVYAGRVLVVVLARPRRVAVDQRRADGGTSTRGEEGAPTGRRMAAVAQAPGAVEVPRTARTVAWGLALGGASLTVLALPPVAEAFSALVAGSGTHAPGPEDLALAGGLSTALLAAVLLRPGWVAALQRGPLPRWAGLRALLTPRPWLALARAVAAVDDRVVDRAVVGAAAGVRRLASGARRTDEGLLDGAATVVATSTRRLGGALAGVDAGVVDAAVMRFARAVRRLGGVLRRPQTGLLHQYYVQALVGLGVLLVLLLVVR